MKLSVAKSHKCVCKHHVIIAHIYKYNYMLIETHKPTLFYHVCLCVLLQMTFKIFSGSQNEFSIKDYPIKIEIYFL